MTANRQQIIQPRFDQRALIRIAIDLLQSIERSRNRLGRIIDIPHTKPRRALDDWRCFVSIGRVPAEAVNEMAIEIDNESQDNSQARSS